MKTSLLRIFFIPFLILMMSLAAMISWVLYRSGEDVTDAVAQKTLDAISYRIQGNVERHLSSAHVILNAVAPESLAMADKQFQIPLTIPGDLSQIEERLWIATGLFPEINHLAYFAAEDGGFVSVKRMLSHGLVEVRYRQPGASESHVYSMSGPRQKIALLRSDQFEAKQRPWYVNAVQQGKPCWSQVYIDFTSQVPLLTLSKPVYRPAHTPADNAQSGAVDVTGVVATDLSLKQLTIFLQKMPLPLNGVAFIMEKSDELVATSLSEIPYTRVNDTTLKRQAATESASAIMRAGARHVRQNMMNLLTPGKPLLQIIEGEQQQLQLAATLLKNDEGLQWVSVIVVPRASLRVESNSMTTRSMVLGWSVILLMCGIGYAILRWTVADIHKLADAARNIGTGEPFQGLNIHRQDEIGVLAESLQDMEKHLRTDALTQLLNRDTFISQIDFKRRRATDQQDGQFTLLYMDLDHFKAINDAFGHAAGDMVLVEAAKRLRSTIRKDDAAARFGGDEFVVYLHGVQDIAFIKQLCNKIREKLEAPIDLGSGHAGYISASIGVAIYPVDGQEIDILLRVADGRMFDEKKRRKAEVDAH